MAGLAATVAARPPARLRGAVLAAATARRPAAGEDASAGYGGWVDRFDALLGGLTPAQWRQRVVHDWTAQDLVAHLLATDGLLVAQLDAGAAEAPEDPAELDGALPGAPQRRGDRRASGPTPERTRAAWRAQADQLLGEVGEPGALDRRVRLSDPRLPRQPLGTALVQRLFETWIHTGDLGAALGGPAAPPEEGDVGLIVGFGVGLLPAALRLAGADRPPRSARLVLVGPGGGDWTISPAVQRAPARPPDPPSPWTPSSSAICSATAATPARSHTGSRATRTWRPSCCAPQPPSAATDDRRPRPSRLAREHQQPS